MDSGAHSSIALQPRIDLASDLEDSSSQSMVSHQSQPLAGQLLERSTNQHMLEVYGAMNTPDTRASDDINNGIKAANHTAPLSPRTQAMCEKITRSRGEKGRKKNAQKFLKKQAERLEALDLNAAPIPEVEPGTGKNARRRMWRQRRKGALETLKRDVGTRETYSGLCKDEETSVERGTMWQEHKESYLADVGDAMGEEKRDAVTWKGRYC